MMNDKDLQRKMKEKIESIVIDLLKTGQLDEKSLNYSRLLAIKSLGLNLKKLAVLKNAVLER
mgnify:CR=1 FL=1